MPKKRDPYQTYWVCNGKKVYSYDTMEQKVMAGAFVIEVSETWQREQAEYGEKLERERIVHNDRLQRQLMEIRYRRSPEGQRAEALRIAHQNPGGLVSGVESSNFAELDTFGRDATNLLR